MISSGHFRVDTGPALRWTSSVRWAYAHFLREWRRRLAQSSGDTPDWKWGRPLRPQRKVSSPARLLELSKPTAISQRGKTYICLPARSGGRIASSALHRLSDALNVMKRPPQAVDRPILTNGKPVSDSLLFLPACASDSFQC